MATVAVLGMGLLGSGFALQLLEQGHTVRVWNRTASKCDPLAAEGAEVAADPAEAVRGAERVHLVLAEDFAVDSVIAAMRPGLADGTPIIDHSTNLPATVVDRCARLAAEGVPYLHAPVFMGPRNSRDATGLMLVSGPTALVKSLVPVLATMTGRVMELGERVDKAAAIKLVGNGMLFMLTASMGDLFRMGSELGLEPTDVVGLFDQFSPTPAIMGRRVLAAGDGPVGFETTMARKDARLMIESAGGPGALVVLPAVAEALDRAIAAGLGSADFALFAKPQDV